MNISATANSPCLNCPDRRLHCHADCEKYKEYKDILERNRAIEYGKTDEANFRRAMKGEVYKRYMKHRKVDGRG